ncbi:MAG TPA: hypothetical protein VGJ32_00460 [Solirubrobacteraceae bacterium]|jgi:hypothetical protein
MPEISFADQDLEHASFYETDPDCLVEAALACPACLHAVDWRPAGTGSDAAVDCRCRHCGHARTVALSGAQSLRLLLAESLPY